MKKTLILLLVLLLVTTLWGCEIGQSITDDPVNFYYPWSDLEAMMKQNPHCTVVGSELHEISGNRDSLAYVLSLYFLGPQDSALTSPFPKNTALLSVQEQAGRLTLTLSSNFSQLKGIDLTIACTCLAKTCLDLTDADSIYIRSEVENPQDSVSFTITRKNLLLSDTQPETIPAAE